MQIQSFSDSRNALPVVLLFVLFWSLEILATKASFLAGAKVLPFTVQSSLCALVVLGLWTIPREGRQILNLLKNQRGLLGRICIANSIHYGLGSFLYTFGTMQTSATNVAFLVTLSTPFSSILAIFILGETIRRERAILLCTLALGAYILSTNLESFVPHPGDLLIVGAAFFWSLGNVLLRKTLRDSPVSGEVVSLFKPIVGIPIFLLSTLFASSYPEPMKGLFSESLFNFDHFGYTAIAGTMAALLWIFLYRSLKIAQSAYVSMLGMATPVMVAFAAAIFLNEHLSAAQVAGAVIILLSGVITHLSARSAARV